MPTINLSSYKTKTYPKTDLSTLKCATCEHLKIHPHTTVDKQFRCTYNSTYGMRIHRAKLIAETAPPAPAFCPLLTDKDIKIHQGTQIAQLIGKKNKQLQEAIRLTETLPGEIEALKQQLQETLDSVDLSQD